MECGVTFRPTLGRFLARLLRLGDKPLVEQEAVQCLGGEAMGQGAGVPVVGFGGDLQVGLRPVALRGVEELFAGIESGERGNLGVGLEGRRQSPPTVVRFAEAEDHDGDGDVTRAAILGQFSELRDDGFVRAGFVEAQGRAGPFDMLLVVVTVDLGNDEVGLIARGLALKANAFLPESIAAAAAVDDLEHEAGRAARIQPAFEDFGIDVATSYALPPGIRIAESDDAKDTRGLGDGIIAIAKAEGVAAVLSPVAVQVLVGRELDAVFENPQVIEFDGNRGTADE